jgi:very-short-patch-repair endonuclease
MSASRARQLRGAMTDTERRLWSALRSRRLEGYKFRRQHPIGPFVADFACLSHRLVIEADGGQHAENQDDRRRTIWLARRGWRVVRFWNNDILTNPEGVQDVVLEVLSARSARFRLHPHPPGPSGPGPSLSRKRERGSDIDARG